MKKTITIIIVIVALVGGYFAYSAFQQTQDVQAATSAYDTTEVEVGTLHATIDATGVVRSNQRATLTWSTSGNVGEVHVGVGDQVAAGDVLAEMAQLSLPQSVILAEAVAIHDGRNAVQTQSYGPEARGGASKSEVIISDGRIDYPKVMSADLLLALSQEACDEYFYSLAPNGTLIVDSEQVERVPSSRAVEIPITRIAEEATGRAITANSVGLGVVGGLTGIVSRQALEKAVEARVPQGTADLNIQAVAAGWEAALKYKQQTES